MTEQDATAVAIVLLTLALILGATLFFVDLKCKALEAKLLSEEWDQIMKELEPFIKQEELKK